MKLPFALLFGADDLPRIIETARTGWGAGLCKTLDELCDAALANDAALAGSKDSQGSLHAAMALAFRGLLRDSARDREAAKARVMHYVEWEEWAKGGAMLHRGDWTSAISLLLDWGWEAYTPEEARAVLEALVAHAIENGDPAAPLNNYEGRDHNIYAIRSLVDFADYEWRAAFHRPLDTTNNWDVVTAAGLMLGATTVELAVTRLGMKLRAEKMGFELDAARLERWHSLARERLQNFCSRCYTADGQYSEGPGYYSYGTYNALLGMEVARRHRGENLYTLGMLRSPRWQRELYPWRVADGAMNFNDSELPGHPLPSVLARLAAESRDPAAQGFFLELLPEVKTGSSYKAFRPPVLCAQIPLALAWADPKLEAAAPGDGRFFDFGEMGDVVGRSGRDPGKDAHWVFRCGKWNGAHTHLDRNSIMVSAYGERLLVDAGCYNSYTVEPHTNYHTQTVSHNCVLVNGKGQTGSKKLPTHGRIVHAAARPDGGALVVGDAKQCYDATSTALRAVQFEPAGFWIVYDYLKADTEHFDCLWHFYNMDGLGTLEETECGYAFKRPRASLMMIPVLPPESAQRSTGWINTQEHASTGLSLRRPEGKFLHLLVPLHAGEELACSFEAGNGASKPGHDSNAKRKLVFELRGKRHTLEPAGDGAIGWLLDGVNPLPPSITGVGAVTGSRLDF